VAAREIARGKMMQVTLTIADDVHAAAKAIAQREKITLGQVITEMMRLGMEDELRRHSMSTAYATEVAPQASDDLGKRIQKRFKGLGQMPIPPRRSIRSQAKKLEHYARLEGR
jgi:hypothetical protein